MATPLRRTRATVRVWHAQTRRQSVVGSSRGAGGAHHRALVSGGRRTGSRTIVRCAASVDDEEKEEEPKLRKAKKGGETVVGVSGVPQGVIDAERKANPLRRWRLAVYALAASVAGAQAVDTCLKLGTDAVGGDSVGSVVLIDVLVILVGAGLWRVELFNRANNLARIWKEAEFRAESLRKAEAGEGDTLWTARVRGLKTPGKR